MSASCDLSESAKDNIRSRIASTVQSASIRDNNLTKDEQQALKQLKTDDNIVILLADKGRVTVVMDKTDYFDKMDVLVNDKQTYEELKRDPTPALQRKLNSKIFTLKKSDAIDTTLLPTEVLSATTTETLRTTETAQTWYTYATYSVILWVPYVPTV